MDTCNGRPNGEKFFGTYHEEELRKTNQSLELKK